MYTSGREYTQIKRPVNPPISLDTGGYTFYTAVASGGFVVIALVLASIGGWLVVQSWRVSGLGVAIGLVLAVVGAAFGVLVMWVSLGQWLDYRQRLADWHAVTLAAYQDTGTEIVEHVSEWDFSADNSAHVLVAALAVARRVREGEAAPWSVRSLQGPVFVGSRQVGRISKVQAIELGKKFSALGLVAGRQEGYAGDWSVHSFDELVRIIWKSF